MSQVEWIKMRTDIFEDEKIKLIESLPEGDTIIVIWMKLLTHAGKINDHGYIYLREGTPYTPQMLSIVYSRPQPVIELALKMFVDFGMIEIQEKGIFIVNWHKHQNVIGLDEIREKERMRKQKQRQRQREAKQLQEGPRTEDDSQPQASQDGHGTEDGDKPKVSQDSHGTEGWDKSKVSRDSHGTSHGDVPSCPATDKEEDKEKEIDKEKELKDLPPINGSRKKENLCSHEDVQTFVESLLASNPLSINPKLIVKYVDCIRLYRQTARISVNIVKAQWEKWQKYHPDVVTYAMLTHLDKHDDKPEKYTIGIMRQTSEHEARRELIKIKNRSVGEEKDAEGSQGHSGNHRADQPDSGKWGLSKPGAINPVSDEEKKRLAELAKSL